MKENSFKSVTSAYNLKKLKKEQMKYKVSKRQEIK